MTAEAIAQALDGKREGGAWRCLCPVHQGHALIAEDKNGKTLVHCHTQAALSAAVSTIRKATPALLSARIRCPLTFRASQPELCPFNSTVPLKVPHLPSRRWQPGRVCR